jgi:class 3 adenylate cyclase/DNA polymerase III delta prime subunit
MAGTGAQLDTRVVLFTDLVGSTELRVRLGEEAADALQRAHDALLAEAVTANGGTVVKGLGDGILATFDAAADGVGAAVAVQQAADGHGRAAPDQAFSVRVGLSVGDVAAEGDDVFGVPVVEAARLCAAAAGGEILAADLVRALARGRGGFSFEPMGELELKGLAEPVPACRVLWEPLVVPTTTDGTSVPLPAPLTGALATGYVGRLELRARLGHEWDLTRRGTPRTLLLAGEPGVGKTRTAAEVCRAAFGDGAVVLFGRCDEGLGVPYQPFVEALGHYVAHAAAPALGRLPGELRRLVPDLGPTVSDALQPVASDPASEEHRLFEACASWLLETSRSSPAGCVFVLDDVHWATKPTLLLLQHVVRAVSDEGAPLLVLATYRDTDVTRAHPLFDAIADLRRLAGVARLPVDNLSADEVVDLIAAAAGHELDEGTRRLAEAVYAETEGNPFFVGEVLRHLVETGGVRREGERWVVRDADHIDVPEGVRDVVGRRLNRLSTTANEVLSVAAAVGREFDLELLLALVDGSEDATLDALDEGVRARLVEELDTDHLRFAHALVRTTLYEELSATRRRRLHRRIADVLEKLRPDDVRALAFHCTEAGPDGGDLTRALRYTVAAAEQALDARAFAEADARFRGAIELLEDAEDVGSPLWVVARCGLGQCLRDEGDPGFREVLLEASRRALELGDLDLVLRAVLNNTRGFAATVSDVDEERVEVIDAALGLLGPEPSPARARLLAQLASELTFANQDERRLALTDEAVAMARELGDEILLGDVLFATGYCAMTGERIPELVERNTEAVHLADAHGDPTQRIIDRVFLGGALFALGDFPRLFEVTDEMVAIADAEGSPIARWIATANSTRLSSLRGDLDGADATNDRAFAMSEVLGQVDGTQWWSAVALGHAWARGTLGTLVDQAAEFAEQYPLGVIWRCTHAWCLTDAGRVDEAQAIVAEHALDPRTQVVSVFPYTPCFQLGVVARAAGDAELGAQVVEALAPHAERWAHYYMFGIGPVAWPLGLGRIAAGDLDGGIADLEHGLAMVDAAGVQLVTRPWLHRDLAQALRERGAADDADRADALLDAAIAQAEAIRAPVTAERLRAVR